MPKKCLAIKFEDQRSPWNRVGSYHSSFHGGKSYFDLIYTRRRVIKKIFPYWQQAPYRSDHSDQKKKCLQPRSEPILTCSSITAFCKSSQKSDLDPRSCLMAWQRAHQTTDKVRPLLTERKHYTRSGDRSREMAPLGVSTRRPDPLVYGYGD